MSTVVITTTEKERVKLDNVVELKSKRKKDKLSDSFEGLDLKSPRRLIDDEKKSESFFAKELEKKYKFDFEVNCLSFPRIFSIKSNKKITLQLNMDSEVYYFLRDNMKEIIKENKDLTVGILKKKLQKVIYNKIKETHEGKSISFYIDKSKQMLNEFFRFKRELIFHTI
tara:strand:+ start:478 stop:984 length:507 start_codon:yes stop_codon:yes gene_type:complete